MTQPLPPKGVYATVLRVPRRTSVEIGRLGRREFSAGYYAYVGSALNSLTSRLSRHLRRSKRKHWHIDYLTSNPNVRILGLAWKNTTRRIECHVSRRVETDAVRSEVGFGSGDCRCVSHLHYFRNRQKLRSSLSFAGLHRWMGL